MSENFVTVATYNRTPEAHLAKNLLEEEGIPSLLSGELTADMLPFGQAGGGDQIVLQVPESAAQRAAGILATVAAAKLEDNWEDEAESGSDVWICSICGEPISNRLSMCYSCQTPREGIRTSAPREQTAIQEEPVNVSIADAERKGDEILLAPVTVASVEPAQGTEERMTQPDLLTDAGDDLARRALLASMCWVLLPLAWFYLFKLFFLPGELSRKGMLYLCGAMVFNGLFILMSILVVVWF